MKSYFLCFLILLPVLCFAQRVQLNGLPGEDGGMDITQLLDQIMDPYRNQVTNLKNKKTDKEVELEVWTGIRTNIENFDRINRYIFSFESAFRDVTNTVSDPSVLEVTTARNAEKGKHTITVKRLAAPDAFSSAPVPLEEKISPSRFTVKVGTEETIINFSGGTINDLAAELRANLSNNLDIELINSSEKTRSILIRGQKSGKDSKISFGGNLKALRDVKLLSEGELKTSFVSWNQADKNAAITNGSLQKALNTPILPNTTLDFTASVSELPQSPETVRTKIEASPLGEYSNFVELPGASPLLDEVAPADRVKEESPSAALTLYFSGGAKEKIVLNGKTGHSLSLSQYTGKTLEKAEISSPQLISSVEKLSLSSLPEGGLAPFNTISQAQDALFAYDGVDLERPANTISDLARGVTLELKKESPDKVSFSISPNIELIQNTVTQWALAYNAVVDNVYNASTLPMAKIGKMKALHLRKKDGEDTVEGALLSNPGLLSYRSALRQLIGNPYGSSTNKIALLDQIGLYVQRVRGGAPTDPESIRRGLLTLDTAQLKQALTDSFEDVAKLFANNTTGEGIANMGVAVAATQANSAMIGGNGYITRINQDSGNKIRSIDKDITKKEEEMVKTERTERANLLRMNQALAASKAQAESLRQRFGN